jgi:hypothetical protein
MGRVPIAAPSGRRQPTVTRTDDLTLLLVRTPPIRRSGSGASADPEVEVPLILAAVFRG